MSNTEKPHGAGQTGSLTGLLFGLPPSFPLQDGQCAAAVDPSRPSEQPRPFPSWTQALDTNQNN